MKNKTLQMLALLLLLFLLLGGFWVLMDMPAFSAKSAFHRAERAQLLNESTYLGETFFANAHYSGKGMVRSQFFVYAGVGKTDTALHTTELRRKVPFPFWLTKREMVVIPLTGALTAEFLPWGARYSSTEVLVYTEQDFARCEVTLAAEGPGFSVRVPPSETGLLTVMFPEYGDDPHFDEIRREIEWRQYDLQFIGYDKKQKTKDVTMEVVLYDDEGRVVDRLERIYPAT